MEMQPRAAVTDEEEADDGLPDEEDELAILGVKTYTNDTCLQGSPGASVNVSVLWRGVHGVLSVAESTASVTWCSAGDGVRPFASSIPLTGFSMTGFSLAVPLSTTYPVGGSG